MLGYGATTTRRFVTPRWRVMCYVSPSDECFRGKGRKGQCFGNEWLLWSSVSEVKMFMLLSRRIMVYFQRWFDGNFHFIPYSCSLDYSTIPKRIQCIVVVDRALFARRSRIDAHRKAETLGKLWLPYAFCPRVSRAASKQWLGGPRKRSPLQ